MTKTDKPEKSKLRKTLNVIATVVLVIFTAILAVSILSVVIAKIQRKDANVFGYRFIYILTDSMEPELEVGASILVKNCKAEDIKVGDNVTFYSDDPALANSEVKLITHKCVKALYYDETLKCYCIQTQGIKEADAPIETVKAEYVRCKFVSKTPAAFSNFVSVAISFRCFAESARHPTA